MRRMGVGIAVAAGLCGVAGGGRPALAQAARVDTINGWVMVCQGEEPIRRCSAARPTPFTDSQGREHVVTLSLLRDGACTTLNGVFDGPIDLGRPVWLAVDGGPRLEFAAVPPDPPRTRVAAGEGADFRHFLSKAAGGGSLLAAGMVKEPRRVAVTCAAMRELLPRLAAGATLRLEFSPTGLALREQPYHWPALSRRAVDVPLAGVVARLNHHFQVP